VTPSCSALIGEAVREESGQVKDTLDMELRTGRIDAEQRSASRTRCGSWPTRCTC
jgi:hypothetical protein